MIQPIRSGPGMPIFLPLRSAAASDPGRGLGEDDVRELAVERRQVADRDALADRRDDARAIGDADVDGARADERMRSGSILFWNVDVEAGLLVVAPPGRPGRTARTGRSGCTQADAQRRRCAVPVASAGRCGTRRAPPQARGGYGQRTSRGGTATRRARLAAGTPMDTGPPWAAQPSADDAALDEDDDEVEGDAQQGDGQQGGEHERGVEEAAASEVDEDAEAPVGAGPLADDGPTTASVTPTRMPPRMAGRAAGSSRVGRTWSRRGTEGCGPARAAVGPRTGYRPSSRSRPGRRRSASR